MRGQGKDDASSSRRRKEIPPVLGRGTYLSILAPEDLESYMTLLCAGRRLDRGRLSQGSSTNDAPRSVVSNVPLLRRRGRDR